MNIEDYKFSSETVFALAYKDVKQVYLYDENDDGVVEIRKRDVIALAKHFKLTDKDLI